MIFGYRKMCASDWNACCTLVYNTAMHFDYQYIEVWTNYFFKGNTTNIVDMLTLLSGLPGCGGGWYSLGCNHEKKKLENLF